VRLVQANFHQITDALAGLGIHGGIAGFLADLGVSSLQLETPARGFSFRLDGPLDMRMGLSDMTAADLVNQASEGELETIFRDYGEERQARRIARAISRARTEKPIATTGELQRLVAGAKGARAAREERIDPATRVFQALRIAVNEELAGLERCIEETVRLLETDGRLVVISYHSLEDRIVKNTLRDLARGEVDPVTGRSRSETQLIEVLTRKPVRPAESELDLNPRARSGKLRAARRL
jgi:16S rRNA (cytosine1402-N4)-methyltransferase